MGLIPGQRSFDDLGTPLREVTFVVVDLETTGSSPDDDAITEVGAVRSRGGERLGSLGTLVNPGRSVPPRIAILTGITDALVAPAPRIEAVLPSLAELCSGAVLVGHNVRFDLAFLRRAFERAGWPAPDHPVVDTLALARRLLADEVRDHRLSTLARQLRLAHRPTHRALADAEATLDLLHVLLERAGRMGVLGLDDLLALPTMAGHPSAAKLRLTERLPRVPGVYAFRDRRDEVLYVGKAVDLRARVRSYFSSDRRRKVASLLRETQRVDHWVMPGPFAPEVAELRMIQRLGPRFNRQGRRRSEVWLELTLGEPFPRLVAARRHKDDGGLYLGPFSSRRSVDVLIDAIHDASRLRRCTLRPRGRALRESPCAAGQLGVSLCPCTGDLPPDRYEAEVRRVRDGLTTRPELLLAPLRDRMGELAARQRYEDAAVVRDRAEALARAVEHDRRTRRLREVDHLEVTTPLGRAVLERGRLVAAADPTGRQAHLPPPVEGAGTEVDEARLLLRLLDAATGARAERIDGRWSSPWPAARLACPVAGAAASPGRRRPSAGVLA